LRRAEFCIGLIGGGEIHRAASASALIRPAPSSRLRQANPVEGADRLRSPLAGGSYAHPDILGGDASSVISWTAGEGDRCEKGPPHFKNWSNCVCKAQER